MKYKSCIWILKQYIRYLSKAKNPKGHGVHPPFVYGFIRKVLIDTNKYEEYLFVERYREKLKSLSDEVEFKDYGAGSKTMNSSKIRINEIVKNSSVKRKYGRLLFRMVRYFNPNTILEIGTSLGVSTMYLSLADPNSNIYTIEGNENLLNFLKDELEKQNIENVHTYCGEFDIILPELLDKKNDMAFIDGNHSKKATLKYFNLLKANCHNDSVLIFDDIYWSREMADAWREIKEDKDVTLTIDIFQFGLVFFRKESSKQNFIIKF